jgi:beta propeller repeat protein
MQNNKKLYILPFISVIAILFLILVSSMVLASTIESTPLQITETKITTSGSVDWSATPAIYGDRIVWADNHKGDLDIYMYDLSTKKKNPDHHRRISPGKPCYLR